MTIDAYLFITIVSTVCSLAAIAIIISTFCLFYGGALYLGTPGKIVNAMVCMADIQPGEKVYDLGCGDARLLIASHKKCQTAQGIGIDISTTVLAIAWLRNILFRSPVKLIRGNVADVDFSDADVIFCYLMPELLTRIDEKLRALKPGTRIISHQFELVGWLPMSEVVIGSDLFKANIWEYLVGASTCGPVIPIPKENHSANRARWHENRYSSFY